MKKLLSLALLASALATTDITAYSRRNSDTKAMSKPVQKAKIRGALNTVKDSLDALSKLQRKSSDPASKDAYAVTEFVLLRIQLLLSTMQQSIDLKKQFKPRISKSTQDMIENTARPYIRQDAPTLTEAFAELIQDAYTINGAVLNQMRISPLIKTTLLNLIKQAHDAAQKALQSAMTPYQQERIGVKTGTGGLTTLPNGQREAI